MWPTSESSQELIANAQRGTAGAADDLLAHYRDSVRRLIDMRLDPAIKQRLDASDIVQEVLIDAHRRLDEYLADPQVPFHIWLRAMAKDRIIDAHRRHRVAARRSVDREQALAARPNLDESTLDLAAQLAGRDMTPATAATWHELNRRFQNACDQLDEQDREIVFMRHFEQLNNSEVAAALNLTPQAASMRYLRAMRRLRKLLDE